MSRKIEMAGMGVIDVLVAGRQEGGGSRTVEHVDEILAADGKRSETEKGRALIKAAIWEIGIQGHETGGTEAWYDKDSSLRR